MRSRDVDVKVFDGEVESLAVAVIEGVGIRVIDDHRQGYAWSGSLDPEVVAETLADARDNAGFGAPDDAYALATPADFAGVTPSTLDLWRDDVLAVDTARKVALALELDAATKAFDPRVRGVESSTLRRRRDRECGRELVRRRSAHPAHDVLDLRVRDGGRRRGDAHGERVLGGAHVRRARRRGSRARRRRTCGAPPRRAAAGVASAAGRARPARHPVVARPGRQRAGR